MRKTSCCLFQKIHVSNLMSLKLSICTRYLNDLLNIDNNFFDSMVNHIYPLELQLNKANVSDTEASFLDLHLSRWDGLLRLIFMINEII